MTRSRMRFFLAAAAALLIAGAHAQPASVKRFALDAEIPQPDLPLIQSPGNFKAFLLGGGIATAIDQQTAGKAFREYMRKNNIDITQIVSESFKRVVEEDKTFALGADADAKLKLQINAYGFGASGFTGGNERKPLLNISASLVAGDGKVVWKKTEFITNLSKLTEAYTYDQLGQNPELTVKSFEQVSLLVSRQLLAALKK